MRRRGGMEPAMDVIELLAKRGLFRAKELNAYDLSQNWLNVARGIGLVHRHGHGVWNSPSYRPTRYEIAQLRFPLAVFWGPSALWLHGAVDAEPEPMWIAIANKSRPPSTLEIATVIIRTRHLERGVMTVLPPGGRLELRAYDLERAQRDVARIDPYRVLERATERSQFYVAPNSGLLSTNVCWRPLHPIPAPPDRWTRLPASAAIRTPAPARSRSGSTTLPSPPRR